MRLNEFYNKPLNEIVKEMELADIKIHTDDDNNIRTIEVKYAVSTKEEKNKFCSYTTTSTSLAVLERKE